ncbi:hypothetical protein ElyMa_003966000 [Elysia marginata]|uniref:Uncharacterized protein n=1 Tax=Elysia marginata TaxID=1093978 RepID=A0AAV4FVS9_9GAST|nr:hypothetical protein ElyMa_003966000 [Elysia marginata]
MEPLQLIRKGYVDLDLPDWMTKALKINGDLSAVYINPHNNREYVVYEPPNPFVDADCYNYCSDTRRHTAVAHVAAKGTKKRRRVGAVKKEPPFKREPARIASSSSFDFSDGDWEDAHMCFDTFLHYCASRCDTAPAALIREIYQLLDGYVITEKVMDVVVSTVRRINSKNIRNTARQGNKMDKKSKKQLKYILDGIADRRLTNICV